MPHFIIECSDDVLADHDKQAVMQYVFDAAEESGLFAIDDIKVRIRPYADTITASTGGSFLHVFAYIMEGRSDQQKNMLSRTIVSRLKDRLADVPIVSMNVMEFEKASYNNRDSV